MKAPPEDLAYTVCTYAGTDVKKPDYLATIDLDPTSKSYSKVIHRLVMSNVAMFRRFAKGRSQELWRFRDDLAGGHPLREAARRALEVVQPTCSLNGDCQ